MGVPEERWVDSVTISINHRSIDCTMCGRLVNYEKIGQNRPPTELENETKNKKCIRIDWEVARDENCKHHRSIYKEACTLTNYYIARIHGKKRAH